MPLAMQWRRLDTPGSETAFLERASKERLPAGFAVFMPKHQPCGLSYAIRISEDWRTLSANISGHVGIKRVDFQIHV
jgi:hypothetical protein